LNAKIARWYSFDLHDELNWNSVDQGARNFRIHLQSTPSTAFYKITISVSRRCRGAGNEALVIIEDCEALKDLIIWKTVRLWY